MRLLLDTNVLVYFLYSYDYLSPSVKIDLLDFSNVLFTSTVCVQELIHLCQTGKIKQNAEKVISDLDNAGINIEQVTERHLKSFASLPLYDDHRDPNDRMIISQAISDRIPLVSSDRKFLRYERHGLNFIYNER